MKTHRFTVQLPILSCLALAFSLSPAVELRADGDDERLRKKRSDRPDLSPVPANEQSEDRFREKLGPSFKLKRTAHFSIFYDVSEEDVQTFDYAVERTYASCIRYVAAMGIDYTLPSEKLIAVFFNERSDFRDYMRLPPSRKLFGVYDHSTRAIYFYNQRNTVDRKKRREQAEAKLKSAQDRLLRGGLTQRERRKLQSEVNRARKAVNRANSLGGGRSESTLQHEVAHQVFFHIGFHNLRSYAANPAWFKEGMAQLFEPISDGRSANYRRVNTYRLSAFRKLVQEDQLIPLRELVGKSPDYDGFGPHAWALVHYLSRTRRDELRTYAQLLLDRPADYRSTPEAEIETFEKAFGTLNDAWERRWLSWMEKVPG